MNLEVIMSNRWLVGAVKISICCVLYYREFDMTEQIIEILRIRILQYAMMWTGQSIDDEKEVFQISRNFISSYSIISYLILFFHTTSIIFDLIL